MRGFGPSPAWGCECSSSLLGAIPTLTPSEWGAKRIPSLVFSKALAGRVARVPFQFAVIRAARFLREIGPVRQGPKGILARLAASTGVAAVAGAAWRRTHSYAPPSGYSFEEIASWPSDLNAVWKSCRDDFHFALARDARAVQDLHAASQGRLHRYVLRRGNGLLGWSAGLFTQMRESPYFGNLLVGTILDALAPPEHLDAWLAHTYHGLRELGADLIVANYTHECWRDRFRRLGFFNGPSNYLLALSKPLAAALGPGPNTLDRAYMSRADGDGRLNL